MELQSQIIPTLGHKGYERYLLVLRACRDWAAFERPRGIGFSVPRGSLTENYSPPSMLNFAGRSQVRAPMYHTSGRRSQTLPGVGVLVWGLNVCEAPCRSLVVQVSNLKWGNLWLGGCVTSFPT